MIKHGQARRGHTTRTYRIWAQMLHRCGTDDPNYGGRGISVCQRWRDFRAFYSDMGACPPGLEIDRWPNNDGNYEPGNCRWATRSQQCRNTSQNRWIEFNGQRKILIDWASDIGITPHQLIYRLEHWPLRKALTVPIIRQGRTVLPRKLGASGVRGVYLDKRRGKWNAEIKRRNGIYRYIGSFVSKASAARAVRLAMSQMGLVPLGDGTE